MSACYKTAIKMAPGSTIKIEHFKYLAFSWSVFKLFAEIDVFWLPFMYYSVSVQFHYVRTK